MTKIEIEKPEFNKSFVEFFNTVKKVSGIQDETEYPCEMFQAMIKYCEDVGDSNQLYFLLEDETKYLTAFLYGYEVED